MKIIKNNHQDPVRKTSNEITCPECKSVLQYTADDLTHTFWRTEGWTNSNIKYKGFICPCCSCEIGIKTLYAS